MRACEVQAILQEASGDKRIEVEVLTSSVRDDQGYRLKLTWRKLRVVTIRLSEQWHDVKRVWSEM